MPKEDDRINIKQMIMMNDEKTLKISLKSEVLAGAAPYIFFGYSLVRVQGY